LTDVRESLQVNLEDTGLLKREESKTTLAMKYRSPTHDDLEKPTSPPTPVIDHIALLRAQNV